MGHTTGLAYRDVATYTCDTGYLLFGDSTLTCNLNGAWDWSGSFPTCSIVSCTVLTDPTWGSVETPNGITYGEIATYSCNIEYNLVGSNTTTCQATKQWTNPTPTCIIVECTPVSPVNGSVNPTYGTTYGQTVTYTCDIGFDIVGYNTTNCTADGIWDPSVPTCNPVDCNAPESTSNGNVTFIATTYGQLAKYTCEYGYAISVIETSTCLHNRSWSSPAPFCTFIDCRIITNTNQDIVNITTNGTYLDDVADYVCNDGYNLTTSVSSRVCLYNSSWSNEPFCVPVDCGNLFSPVGGTVDTSNGTKYGNVAIYTCNMGYYMTGDKQRHCLANATWSSNDTLCTVHNCGYLEAPMNGSVDQMEGTTYGNIAYFSCDTGFYLSVENVSKCQADGIWNNSNSTCIIHDCGALPQQGNGQVDLDGTLYGDVAEYSCQNGYVLNGTANRTCLSDGYWEEPGPTCNPIDCGIPQLPPENGTMSVPGGTQLGDSAWFNCVAGLVASPVEIRNCLSSGQWSSGNVTCIVPPPTTSTATTIFISTTPAPNRMYVMPCLCFDNGTFDGMTKEEIISKLISDTSIDTSNTTLSTYTLKCRTDPRMSSTVIGTVGAGFMGTLLALIVCIDLLSICKHIKNKKIVTHT